MSLREEIEERHLLKRFATPDEIAYGMLYLASDESTFATGSMLSVDGGQTAH